MSPATTIHIETVDGDEHVFEFTSAADEHGDYNVRGKIEKLLSQQSIALAVDDRLLILPMHRIASIEVFPLTVKLPEAVVPRVTEVATRVAALTT